MSPRQTGQIPAKADRQKQREFHDRALQPLPKQCLQKDWHVLFMDSAHFVLAAFVSMVWCFERVFIKGASGRFRLNVIGVVHAATKEFTGFFNTFYINADSVVQLLQRIAIDYPGKPIYIVLDNARYQHCKLVMETAKQLQIINRTFFLPKPLRRKHPQIHTHLFLRRQFRHQLTRTSPQTQTQHRMPRCHNHIRRFL